MSAGASASLQTGLDKASHAELAEAFKAMPAAERAKVVSALGGGGTGANGVKTGVEYKERDGKTYKVTTTLAKKHWIPQHEHELFQYPSASFICHLCEVKKEKVGEVFAVSYQCWGECDDPFVKFGTQKCNYDVCA